MSHHLSLWNQATLHFSLKTAVQKNIPFFNKKKRLCGPLTAAAVAAVPCSKSLAVRGGAFGGELRRPVLRRRRERRPWSLHFVEATTNGLLLLVLPIGMAW